ncbi:MAG: NAD-dependent epimerase/dehydratase family protein [Acidobacteriota bacterium]
MSAAYWREQRVLVGGGCGFLGSYLVPLLADSGARITVVDNLASGHPDALAPVAGRVEFVEADLSDPAVCDRHMHGKTAVLNLAARAFGMDYSRSHHGQMLVHNLLCTLAPLEAARRHGVTDYLVVSSSCVYPDDGPTPTPELEAFSGRPEAVNEGYGWAKRIQELAGTYFAAEHRMRVTIVRPFNVYGGRYRWRDAQTAHVVPSLVKRVMDGEDPLIVWGSGQQRRNLLHGSDAAELMLRVVESAPGPEPVNIGYEDDTSISELVDLICEVAGVRPAVVFDTSKPEGRFRKSADATRLRLLTGGYTPRVSLREGLLDMKGWYDRTFGRGERSAG